MSSVIRQVGSSSLFYRKVLFLVPQVILQKLDEVCMDGLVSLDRELDNSHFTG